jgi:DNA repair protein RAD50
VSRKREVDLKAELAYQEYHIKVETEYLALQFHLSTREGMAKDIEAHCKGIEAAVSHFHKDKMELVNQQLAGMWREIYHGQDITLIEIQAAYEEDSKHRRSYSYTILMEKGGKKMEMMGRCSMGQKVLATIVIRLALAEVFGNSARILALDEPTTNLDPEQIGRLAQ